MMSWFDSDFARQGITKADIQRLRQHFSGVMVSTCPPLSRHHAPAMVGNVRGRASLRKCSAPLVTSDLHIAVRHCHRGATGTASFCPVNSGVMRRTVDAAIGSLRTLRRNLQILLAVALGREILCGHAELLAEHQRHQFRTTVRQ